MTNNQPPATSPLAAAYGGHSMIARLRRVLLQMPSGPRLDDDWQRYGYDHPVDISRSETEHADLVALLAGEGIDVVLVGKDSLGNLDAVFTFDPSIMTDAGAILLSMGKDLRSAEPAAHGETYTELGIPVLGEVVPPGRVEGGDTLWLDEQTMVVGRGYRTNDDGIRQLGVFLGGIGVDLLVYDLPHWTGPGGCLHLLSLISPVDDRLAVVHRPLMAVAFLEELDRRGWELLDIPADEFATLGCNVLAIEPRRVVAIQGNPGTLELLERAGCEVLTFPGAEIALNRSGGPTCLVRPILRDPAVTP